MLIFQLFSDTSESPDKKLNTADFPLFSRLRHSYYHFECHDAMSDEEVARKRKRKTSIHLDYQHYILITFLNKILSAAARDF